MDYNIQFIKGFIELAKKGYDNNWHERNGGISTSELLTHLMNHEMKKRSKQ